jgi:hypothetical protein
MDKPAIAGFFFKYTPNTHHLPKNPQRYMLYALGGNWAMREKNENTHILIERELRIYKRERSAVWQCAFNVDGRWQRTSTNDGIPPIQ